MKNLIRFSSLICILLVLSTCKKDNDQIPPEGVVIAKEVKVIDDNTWKDQFISLDTSNYTITFSNNPSSIQQIIDGDIILSSLGEGLLRRVKNVSTVNDQIIVQTEDATITEVIQQGLIEIDQQLTVSQIKSIDYHYAGIKLNKEYSKSGSQKQFNWDINAVLYDYDGRSSTTADQIKLEGTFNCDWRLTSKIDVGFFEGLKEVKFGFESSESLNLQLIAGLQYSFEKKITLATVNFSPIVVTVGIVPIVFTPQLKVIVGFDGSANGSVTSEINQSLTFNAGIKYVKSSGWAPFQTFTNNLTFQPPQLNLNASAGSYLKPELLIKVYSVAGPYANLKLYGRLDADLLQTPWWKLTGGITLSAGAKVNILDKFILDFSVNDLLKYEKLLAQATTPPVTVPTVTTSIISTFTSTTAVVGGNIITDGGATVSERGVYYGTSSNPETTGTKLQIGSGIGTFSSNLTGLTANTRYYVKAYAKNSVGINYGSQASFTTSQN